MRDRIRKIAFETRLYRRDSRIHCRVVPAACGVRLLLKVDYEIINQSLERQSCDVGWIFEEADSPSECQVTAYIGDERPSVKTPTFETADGLRRAQQKFTIEPKSHGIRYRFTTQCSCRAPSDWYHQIYFGLPSIDTTVEIEGPEGWDLWVGGGKQSRESLWHDNGLKMTGEKVSVHWRSPRAS